MSKEFKMGFIEEVEPLKLTTIPKKYQKLIETIENRWFNKMQKLAKICQKRIDVLEHRLSNCIEPKFKVGQEVYMIDSTRVEITGYKIIHFDNPETLYRIKDDEITFGNIPENELFATKEDAKKHLEELKNG